MMTRGPIASFIDDIDIVEAARNLLQLNPVRQSSDWVALCPFHADTHPSMLLRRNIGRRDHFHCFACSAHGDIVKLASRTLNLDSRDAIAFIATRSGRHDLAAIAVREAAQQQGVNAVQLVQRLLAELAAGADGWAEYASKRQLPPDVMRQAEAGWFSPAGIVELALELPEIQVRALLDLGFLREPSASVTPVATSWRDPAVTFPVRDRDGALIGVAARAVGDVPKQRRWRFTRGFNKSSTYFGADAAQSAIRLNVELPLDLWVVEGIFDALRLRQHGALAIAALGSVLSKAQLALIRDWAALSQGIGRQVHLHVFPDQDQAGMTAAAINIVGLLEVAQDCPSLRVDVVVLPLALGGPAIDGDPDSILLEEPSLASLPRHSGARLLMATEMASSMAGVEGAWDDATPQRREAVLRGVHYRLRRGAALPDLLGSRALQTEQRSDLETEWGTALLGFLEPLSRAPGMEQGASSDSAVKIPDEAMVRSVMAAVPEARASVLRLEFPTDDATWERIQRYQVAWARQIAFDLVNEREGFSRPHAAVWVAKDDDSLRTKAIPPPEDLIAQHYVLRELLNPSRPEADRVPAVRYSADGVRGRRWRTTGPPELLQLDSWGRAVHSFGYVIDDDVLAGRAPPRASGIYKHYWSCYLRYLSHLEEGISLLGSDRVWVRRLDVRSFFDVVPRSGLERIRNLVEPHARIDIPGLPSPTWEWLFNRSFGFDWTRPDDGSLKKGGLQADPQRGIPQGPDLSAWLSNICLFPLDVAAVRAAGRGCVYARYVDDIVLLAASSADIERVHHVIEAQLSVLGMRLAVAKSEQGESVEPAQVAAWLRHDKSNAERMSQIDIPDLTPGAEELTYRLRLDQAGRAEALDLLHGDAFARPPTHGARRNWEAMLGQILATPGVKDRDRVGAAKWLWLLSATEPTVEGAVAAFVAAWNKFNGPVDVETSVASVLRHVAPILEGLARAIRAGTNSGHGRFSDSESLEWTRLSSQLATWIVGNTLVLRVAEAGTWNSYLRRGATSRNARVMLAWRVLDVVTVACRFVQHRAAGGVDADNMSAQFRSDVLKLIDWVPGGTGSEPEVLYLCYFSFLEALGSVSEDAKISVPGCDPYLTMHASAVFEPPTGQTGSHSPGRRSFLNALRTQPPPEDSGTSYERTSALHFLANHRAGLRLLADHQRLTPSFSQCNLVPMPPRVEEPAILAWDQRSVGGEEFLNAFRFASSQNVELPDLLAGDIHVDFEVDPIGVPPDSDVLERHRSASHVPLIRLNGLRNAPAATKADVEEIEEAARSMYDWVDAHRVLAARLPYSAYHLARTADSWRPFGFAVNEQVTAAVRSFRANTQVSLVPQPLPATNRTTWAVGVALADYFGHASVIRGASLSPPEQLIESPEVPDDLRRSLLRRVFRALGGALPHSGRLPELPVRPRLVRVALLRLAEIKAAGDDVERLRRALLLAEVDDELEAATQRENSANAGAFADCLQRASVDAISRNARVLRSVPHVVPPTAGEHRTTWAWRSLAERAGLILAGQGIAVEDANNDGIGVSTTGRLLCGLWFNVVAVDLRHLVIELIEEDYEWFAGMANAPPPLDAIGLPETAALLSAEEGDGESAPARLLLRVAAALWPGDVTFLRAAAQFDPTRARRALVPRAAARELHGVTLLGWAYLLACIAGGSAEEGAVVALLPSAAGGMVNAEGMEEIRRLASTIVDGVVDRIARDEDVPFDAMATRAWAEAALGNIGRLRSRWGIKVETEAHGRRAPLATHDSPEVISLDAERDERVPIWRVTAATLTPGRSTGEHRTEPNGEQVWVWSVARRGAQVVSAGTLDRKMAELVAPERARGLPSAASAAGVTPPGAVDATPSAPPEELVAVTPIAGPSPAPSFVPVEPDVHDSADEARRRLSRIRTGQEGAWQARQRIRNDKRYRRIAFAQWDVDETYSHPLSEDVDSSDGLTDRMIQSAAETRRRAVVSECIRACSHLDVDLLVLPEYSTRPETVAWLSGQKLPFDVSAGTFRLPHGTPPFFPAPGLTAPALSAVVPYIYCKGSVHTRVKVFPAISEGINERICPPVSDNQISLLERGLGRGVSGDLITLVCSEMFLTIHPSVLKVAAIRAEEAARDFGVASPAGAPAHVKTYVERVSDVLSRASGSDRRTIQVVPAMTRRTADYQFGAMSSALALNVFTVFCNSAKEGHGGGHSFVAGPRAWKGGRLGAGSPPGPYGGPRPGVLHNAEDDAKGGLGASERALVVIDLDPNMAADPKPTPQDWVAPLRLVAHLPMLNVPPVVARHHDRLTWPPARDNRHAAKAQTSPMRDAAQDPNRFLDSVDGALKGTAGAHVDQVTRTLEQMMKLTPPSPGLEDRLNAWKITHDLEPYGTPPPTLVDFLWIGDQGAPTEIWCPAARRSPPEDK